MRRLVIDAGALALSKDVGASHIDPDCGYGRLRRLDGEEEPGLRLTSLSQEHGVIELTEPGDVDRFRVGQRLLVTPNHSCLAAAMYDVYHVVRDGQVVDEWPTARGW